MAREIERKFLIKAIPENFDKYTGSKIVQGYLVITDETEIRLRKKDHQFFQTVKTGSGLSRGEYEIQLTEKQFNSLWQLTEGKRVEKTRYEIIYKNKTIELDIYEGNLKKLITAEVEFNSEEESRKFDPPDWFGEEITSDKGYKNQYLAINGIPD